MKAQLYLLGVLIVLALFPLAIHADERSETDEGCMVIPQVDLIKSEVGTAVFDAVACSAEEQSNIADCGRGACGCQMWRCDAFNACAGQGQPGPKVEQNGSDDLRRYTSVSARINKARRHALRECRRNECGCCQVECYQY